LALLPARATQRDGCGALAANFSALVTKPAGTRLCLGSTTWRANALGMIEFKLREKAL
jgi:hypothetical protein